MKETEKRNDEVYCGVTQPKSEVFAGNIGSAGCHYWFETLRNIRRKGKARKVKFKKIGQ